LTSGDVLSRPAPPPDLVISYGPGPEHVADVRLPPARPGGAETAGPLVLFLHGGFWRVAYDRTHTGPFATALASAGFVVCVPEFRRTGQRAGGWPGTFDDVATAVDTLPALIREAAGAHLISDGPMVLAGHSAGGHLALWAASRHQLPPDSSWYAPEGQARGVVALAAVSDMVACNALRLGQAIPVRMLSRTTAEQRVGRALSCPPARPGRGRRAARRWSWTASGPVSPGRSDAASAGGLPGAPGPRFRRRPGAVWDESRLPRPGPCRGR
jgi:pimeloyl-ACP methyl ester carboxylesterase